QEPAARVRMNRMNTPQRPALHNFLHLLIVLPVAVLVRHHRLHSRRVHSFAPEAMPTLISSSRMWGGVQKQKTSGWSSFAKASGCSEVFWTPSSAAALASCSGLESARPTSSNRGLFLNASA